MPHLYAPSRPIALSSSLPWSPIALSPYRPDFLPISVFRLPVSFVFLSSFVVTISVTKSQKQQVSPIYRSRNYRSIALSPGLLLILICNPNLNFLQYFHYCVKKSKTINPLFPLALKQGVGRFSWGYSLLNCIVITFYWGTFQFCWGKKWFYWFKKGFLTCKMPCFTCKKQFLSCKMRFLWPKKWFLWSKKWFLSIKKWFYTFKK